MIEFLSIIFLIVVAYVVGTRKRSQCFLCGREKEKEE